MSTTKRQSGIELMRIISIFMIMIVHATYLTFGFPSLDDVRTEPIKMFGYIGMENITIICVNVFVLISGWFSIKPTIKKVGGLIFQCLFFGILVQLFLYCKGISTLSLKSVNAIITFLPFVNSYIVLCLIAPILNAYCEKVSKLSFRNFLVVFYLWGFTMGWLLNKDMEFYLGKTVICFIGLYLLARYIRLHVVFSNKYDKACIWGGAWAISVLFLTIFEVILAQFSITGKLSLLLMGFSISYISPFVIINSLLFFLCFRKFNFSSNMVNWIAISAFASVLLHGNMEGEYYCPMISQLYENNPFLIFLIKAFCFMSAFFVVGFALDKVRIYLWTKVCPVVESLRDKIVSPNNN